jgi:hypothetical protein
MPNTMSVSVSTLESYNSNRHAVLVGACQGGKTQTHVCTLAACSCLMLHAGGDA